MKYPLFLAININLHVRGHCPTEIAKFSLAYFDVKSPNATKYIQLTKSCSKIKNSQSKTKADVWRKSAGLQGMKWITVHQI